MNGSVLHEPFIFGIRFAPFVPQVPHVPLVPEVPDHLNSEWLVLQAVHFSRTSESGEKISRKKTKIYLVEWYCCYTFVETKIMIWKN